MWVRLPPHLDFFRDFTIGSLFLFGFGYLRIFDSRDRFLQAFWETPLRNFGSVPKTRWLMKTFLLLLPLLLASCSVDHTFDPYSGQDGDPDEWEVPSRPEDYIPPEA